MMKFSFNGLFPFDSRYPLSQLRRDPTREFYRLRKNLIYPAPDCDTTPFPSFEPLPSGGIRYAERFYADGVFYAGPWGQDTGTPLTQPLQAQTPSIPAVRPRKQQLQELLPNYGAIVALLKDAGSSTCSYDTVERFVLTYDHATFSPWERLTLAGFILLVRDAATRDTCMYLDPRTQGRKKPDTTDGGELIVALPMFFFHDQLHVQLLTELGADRSPLTRQQVGAYLKDIGCPCHREAQQLFLDDPHCVAKYRWVYDDEHDLVCRRV